MTAKEARELMPEHKEMLRETESRQKRIISAIKKSALNGYRFIAWEYTSSPKKCNDVAYFVNLGYEAHEAKFKDSIIVKYWW